MGQTQEEKLQLLQTAMADPLWGLLLQALKMEQQQCLRNCLQAVEAQDLLAATLYKAELDMITKLIEMPSLMASEIRNSQRSKQRE